MAQELIYTSAERGLRPGTRGFCTVAHTVGMTPSSIQILEAMSTYKSAFALHEESSHDMPVSWSHYRVNLLGRTSSVLSRVCATSADHTNRSNKLAHHLLIQQRERPAGGPAWVSSQEGMFCEAWEGEPHVIGTPLALPQGDEEMYRAETWESVTGDAGHAGELASSYLAYPDRITVLVFNPGMPMLELVREALRLLPSEERWQVTYNTYFTSLPAGAACVWRCCLADSDELRELRRNPKAHILDLTCALPEPGTSRLVEMARTGAAPVAQKVRVEEPVEGKKQAFKLMPNRGINQISLRPRP